MRNNKRFILFVTVLLILAICIDGTAFSFISNNTKLHPKSEANSNTVKGAGLYYRTCGFYEIDQIENVFEEVENLAKEKYREIENRLRAKLDETKDSKPKTLKLRDLLIESSMKWKPLGFVAQKILEWYGYRPVFRTFLIITIVPFLIIKWTCNRFLLLIDIKKGEINKLVGAVEEMDRKGLRACIDHVGDAAANIKDAQNYIIFYEQLIDKIRNMDKVNDIVFTVKLSAMVANFTKTIQYYKNPESTDTQRKEAEIMANSIKESLKRLLTAVNNLSGKKAIVRIDPEEYLYLHSTYKIYEEFVEELYFDTTTRDLIADSDNNLKIGLCVQAYLKDSGIFLNHLLEWAKKHGFRVPIRLVKGAYEKKEKKWAEQGIYPRCPVFNKKESTDANFELLSEFLIVNKGYFNLAFATHNDSTIAKVMALADYHGLSKDEFEFQMLRAMGDELRDTIVSMGYNMREYTPAGLLKRGVDYSSRRFNELANEDNALTRTMKGKYFGTDRTPPAFQKNDIPTYIPPLLPFLSRDGIIDLEFIYSV